MARKDDLIDEAVRRGLVKNKTAGKTMPIAELETLVQTSAGTVASSEEEAAIARSREYQREVQCRAEAEAAEEIEAVMRCSAHQGSFAHGRRGRQVTRGHWTDPAERIADLGARLAEVYGKPSSRHERIKLERGLRRLERVRVAEGV